MMVLLPACHNFQAVLLYMYKNVSLIMCMYYIMYTCNVYIPQQSKLFLLLYLLNNFYSVICIPVLILYLLHYTVPRLELKFSK